MERHGVAHCIHDMYLLQVPLRITASPVYVRFHGDPAHGGDYQEAKLEIWAKRIDDWRGHVWTSSSTSTTMWPVTLCGMRGR